MNVSSRLLAHLAVVVCVAPALASGCTHGGGAAAPAAPAAVAAAVAPPPAPDTPPRLVPADEARPGLLARVSVAAPARIVGTLDALAKRLELPMPVGQLALDSLIKAAAEEGLPIGRAVVDRLAADAPVVIAVVGKTGESQPAVCIAASFTTATAARQTLDELAPAGASAEGVTERTLARGGERLWTAIDGSTVFLAGKPEHIARACALAREGQALPRAGLVAAVVYPDAIAAAQGTTVPAALGMLDGFMAMAAAASDQKKKGLSPAGTKAMLGAAKLMLEPLGETAAVNLTLDVGLNLGVLLRGDLEPRAGSAFAARTAATVPYAIDPGLPVRGDGTDVMAWSPLGRSWELMAALLGAGDASKRNLEALAELRAVSAGDGSCVLELDTAPPTAICAWALKPGASAKRAVDGYVGVLKASAGWEAEAFERKAPPPRVRKVGDIVVIEKKIDLKRFDEGQRKVVRAVFGGDTQRVAVAHRGGRLLQVFGPAPEKTLAQLGAAGAAPASATPPALAEVLGRTKAHEAILFLDVMGVVAFGLKHAGEAAGQAQAMFGAVPGLAELKAPLVFSLTGGNSVGVELLVPYTSLANAVKVARPFFGQMGAGASGP